MSAWRPYDSQLLPAFFERFEQRWGKGTAAGDIWVLRAGLTAYTESGKANTHEQISLRNDAFRKAVSHAKAFIYGPQP